MGYRFLSVAFVGCALLASNGFAADAPNLKLAALEAKQVTCKILPSAHTPAGTAGESFSFVILHDQFRFTAVPKTGYFDLDTDGPNEILVKNFEANTLSFGIYVFLNEPGEGVFKIMSGNFDKFQSTLRVKESNDGHERTTTVDFPLECSAKSESAGNL